MERTFVAASMRACTEGGWWGAPSYRSLRTIDGTIIVLDQVPPKTVLRYSHDDFMTVTAASSRLASRINWSLGPAVGGQIAGHEASEGKYFRYKERLVPWLEPIAQLLNSKWARSQPPAAVASASSLAEGG